MQLPHIAFFDSGQGGLTVWEAVIKRYPRLNTIYLGDNARYPYGNKGADTVTRYSSEAVFYLTGRGAELVVVACGTASSVAVQRLQNIFRVPVVGIVEGFCAEAVSLARENGSIAVLGTRFTVASGRFEAELKNQGARGNVWARACPLFVPLVEEGVTPGPMADAAAEMYLSDIPPDVSVVMLACTHFPRLARSIGETLNARLGRSVVYQNSEGRWHVARARGNVLAPTADDPDAIILLDSSSSMVRTVEGFLASRIDASRFEGEARHLLCTDAPERFAQVAQLFAQIPLPAVERVLLGV